MKKDRTEFTKEEFISEIEFLENQLAQLEQRLKVNHDNAFNLGRADFIQRLIPLYYVCFDPQKGWIGTANLSGNKVGKPLLEFLASFHEHFHRTEMRRAGKRNILEELDGYDSRN